MIKALSVVGAVVLSALCAAQTAPDGNAHPTPPDLTPVSASATDPFGPPVKDRGAIATPEQKSAFASSVDIEPLRDLAVFHGGRVKVLETLARETMHEIAGRRDYMDYLKTLRAGGGEDVKAFRYDPLFTLLDMTIDPVYYLDKPLVGVAYLPMREALLEKAFPGDTSRIDRWKKVGRVTPAMVDQHLGAIMREVMNERDIEQYRTSAGRVDMAVRIFLDGKQNFVMVAPERADLAWRHVSMAEEGSPARAAALALGEAWRARDAGKVEAAARALADSLPRINEAMYPTGRRTLEMTYNRANAFEWGYWAYFFSVVSLLLAFGTGRRTLAWLGGVLLFVAMGLHGFGFVMRCLIAERFAIQNQFESMTGLSLFAVLVGGVIMVAKRQWLFGAAAATVGFMVLLTATQMGIPGVSIQREAAILNTSVLLKYHVTTVLCSYGLIALGFVVSLFYLGVHYTGRLGGGQALATTGAHGVALAALGEDQAPRARTLGDLDKAQMILLQLAFWTLGVGILLGAWWADHSWGRWWAFDPKETWALITWIIYLMVIHLRFAVKDRGLTTAWMSVLGFIVMLWTYFGVNLLLPGLHAYA